MSRYLARLKAKNGHTVLTVTWVGVLPETMACPIRMKRRLTNPWVWPPTVCRSRT